MACMPPSPCAPTACSRPRALVGADGAACRLPRLPPARPATGPPSLYLRRRLPGAAVASAPCGLAPHRRQWPHGPVPRGGQRARPARRQRSSRLSPSAGGSIPPARGGGAPSSSRRRRVGGGLPPQAIAWLGRGGGCQAITRPGTPPPPRGRGFAPRGARRIHAKARHTAAREGRAPLAVPCAAGTAAPPRGGARLRAAAPSAP